MPPKIQMFMAIVYCQYLSNFYRPIYVFRYDEKTEEIFILAGVSENVEVTIFADGQVRYEVDE